MKVHANFIHKGSEIAEILGSDNVHVLERGRETRPSAPVAIHDAHRGTKESPRTQ